MTRASSQRSSTGRSLVRRAVMAIVLTELLCVLTLAGFSTLHERRARLHSVTVTLEGRADSLFGAIQDSEDAADTVRVDPRELRIPSGDFFAVYDAAGRRIGMSDGGPAELLRLHPSHDALLHTQRVGRHTFRVLQRSYLRIVDRDESPTSGIERPVTIVYATGLDRIWREVFEAIEYYIAVSFVLTFATTVALVAFLHRLLLPIQALASAAAAVSPQDLMFAAPESALGVRELRPLAITLSTMIGELRLAFDRQHRFLGDAAHELKTAVAVVRSSLQLMLLRPRSAALYEEGLQAAVHDNERVEQLIARMLLLARLEEPRPKSLSHGLADVQQTIEGCLTKLAPLMEHAGVHLDRRWPEASKLLQVSEQQSRPVRLVLITPGDLDVLFSNVLVNAIQHSSRGQSIIVRIENGERSACFEVIDHGEGISAEALEHVFERFFRADQSRARLSGGAGLGLSIAKAIVDAAGGDISVTSVVGSGTAIRVQLPYLVEPERF